MTLSLSKKNVLSVMTMTLTMISLISPADAQTACSSTSPDCCWVVESWEKMGKTTRVDRNSATACCSIFVSSTGPLFKLFPPGSTTQTGGVPWVYCTSDGTVTQLKWGLQLLKNSIPSELKNLRNLRELRFNMNSLTGSVPSWLGELTNLEYIGLMNNNQLSGSIPIEIIELTKLKELNLNNNPGLTGTFTPRCKTSGGHVPIVSISGTSVTLSECATTHDCYWVVQSWKKMGKTTSVSATRSTACCEYLDSTTQTSGIPGVECRSTGTVTRLEWHRQELQGSIPAELGNLTNLEFLNLKKNQLSGPIPSSLGNLLNLRDLYLKKNQLSGPIPSSLGNLRQLEELFLGNNQLSGPIPSSLEHLTNLKWLSLRENPGLHGTFAPRCGTYVEVSGTNVVICGCAAASTQPAIFPPPETHADCLASGPALTLAKRTQASSQAYNQAFGGRRYTCHVESTNKNPFADCTNSMAFLCNTSDTTWNSDGAKREICRTAVDQMYGQMNSYWQNVRRDCGQWSWKGSTAISTAASSANCADANNNLIANAFYIQKDLSRVYVTSEFTISQNYGLWSKVTA